MSFGAAMLLGVALLALGAAGGVHLRSRRAGSWAGAGTTAVFALGGVLALWVLVVSNPLQDGGTTEHYHAERVIGEPLAVVLFFCGLALFYLGQLPLGIAIGTAFVFRLDQYGWMRFGLSCLLAPAVFYGAVWMMIVAT